MTRTANTAGNPSRLGFTLVELMIVLTIMTVMMSLSAPSFHRTMQQSHLDTAATTLRTLWTAERIYWLENRTFTADLNELQALDLTDSNMLAPLNGYSFAINSATGDEFNATATLRATGKWSGQLAVTEEGGVTGTIQAAGEQDLTPGSL